MVWEINRRGRFVLLSVGATALLMAIASFGHGGGWGLPAIAQTSADHYLAASADTVHWGYFSQDLEPKLVIDSGDTVTVETLTHHANDDASLMVNGDPGAESVYAWTADFKGVNRRGAGSIDPDVYTVGAGEGAGVHILTGPIYVNGAEPGDVLEVEILDVAPRPSANPDYEGRTFGSNAAAWWGFHYNDMLTEAREVITIYELDSTGEADYATALYNFQWTPQTDPDGIVHEIIDYPGVPVTTTPLTKTMKF